MKAIEIFTYLRSLDGGWMDFKTTVDTFKAGDPETEVKGIAVAWQSYTWALEKALQLGCNVFITHEPTYYTHRELPEDAFANQRQGYFKKKQWIEDQGMVILRCHDLWDQMPGIGITDSWASQLGLEHPVVKDGYYQVYEIPQTRVDDFAKRVADQLWPLGQDGVKVIGPLDRRVSRIGIGTGAVASLYALTEKYQADLAVCTDDAFTYWRDAEYAIDQHIPVIVVNHAVSEEFGIINLAFHLKTAFPQIPVRHIPQGCAFKTISGSGSKA